MIKLCIFCLIANHSWKVDKKPLYGHTLNLSCMQLRCFPIWANLLFLKQHSILSRFFCLIYHKPQILVQGIKTVLTYIFKHQVLYTLTCKTLNKIWQSSKGYLENGYRSYHAHTGCLNMCFSFKILSTLYINSLQRLKNISRLSAGVHKSYFFQKSFQMDLVLLKLASKKTSIKSCILWDFTCLYHLIHFLPPPSRCLLFQVFPTVCLAFHLNMQINTLPLYFPIPIIIWDFTFYPNTSCHHMFLTIMHLVTLPLTSFKIFPRAQQFDPQAEVSPYDNQMRGYRNSRNCQIWFYFNSQGVTSLFREKDNNKNK